MATNSFSVTVEALDGIGNRLGNVAAQFGSMEPLADTGRAQAASDSPLSGGALASFAQTMMDALRTTANLLQEDRSKLARIANQYRSVDEQSSRAAEGLAQGLSGESRLPVLSARQSALTAGILEGVAALDDVVVPLARSVTGASDDVQASLRSQANQIDRSTSQVADVVGRHDPIAGLAVRVVGSVSAGTLRVADSALESVEDVVRGTAAWAQDMSDRADRVLIRPRTRVPR